MGYSHVLPLALHRRNPFVRLETPLGRQPHVPGEPEQGEQADEVVAEVDLPPEEPVPGGCARLWPSGSVGNATWSSAARPTTRARRVRLVAETQPDLAVIDIALKTGSGIDLIKRIKDRNDHVRIVVWSMHSESLYAELALRAGALGYVNKGQATDTIVEAIRRVLEGKVWLSEAMAERMLQRAVGVGGPAGARSRVEALADRELEVFRLIGQAVKTAEIAERLHLSVKTVETYRDRIRQKLELDDGTQLAHYATQWMLENEQVSE